MASDALGQYAIARALRTDLPRDEPKVKIRVVSRAEGHVIAAKMLRAGENDVEVYASDVALFEREVERTSWDGARKRLGLIESKSLPADQMPKGIASLESSFRQIEGRDPLPLVSVTRIEAPAQSARR